MFNEILGHERVKSLLAASLKNQRVGHAYIFEGIEGIGKKKTALEFAKALTCLETPKPCGACKACMENDAGTNPDVQLIGPEEPEKGFKVDEIRSATKELFIKPFRSEKKVLIFDGADSMNEQAQNAFLKTLEEPPEYGVMILIAENAGAFLPTILSRAVTVRFAPLSDAEVLSYLKRRFPESGEDSLSLTAVLAEGSLSRALAFMEDGERVAFRKDAVEALTAYLTDPKGGYGKIYRYLLENQGELLDFANFYLLFLRDVLCYKAGGEGFVVNRDFSETIRSIGEQVPGRKLVCAFDAFRGLKVSVKRNAEKKLAVQRCLYTIEGEILPKEER